MVRSVRISSTRLNVITSPAAAAPRAPRRYPSSRAALSPEALRGYSGGRPATVLTDVRARLMAPPGRGNVRQLENIVERALTFSQGRHDRCRRPRPGGRRSGASAPARGPWLPDEGLDFEATSADSSSRRSGVRSSVRRQQAAGSEAPEPETHHAHREAEASRATYRYRASELSLTGQSSQCHRVTFTGRSFSKASRRPFRAHTRDGASFRPSNSCKRGTLISS